MTRPSLTLALLAGAALAAGVALYVPGIRVVDGDTVRFGFWKWRLAGIDAPAPRKSGWGRAKCDAERDRGVRAKHRLEELVAAGGAQVVVAGGFDPYGNPLADLRVTRDGAQRSAGDVLISEGLARPWTGGAVRNSAKLP